MGPGQDERSGSRCARTCVRRRSTTARHCCIRGGRCRRFWIGRFWPSVEPPTGIPFGGAQGTLTDLFFLILSVDDRGHLRVLARLSRLLADATFLAELRQAADARTAPRPRCALRNRFAGVMAEQCLTERSRLP